ncbi:MAG: hypothetical protein GF331_14295 [Chitinivibrionales bacterium]|nr:hypothetical protein [Chitinivibrionales bacterium]
MSTPVDIQRLKARLGAQLDLLDMSPICAGFARAVQVLRIGDDTVCTDEVLIEEINYPLADEMHAELNSMIIKIGMHSPYLRTSTYPPKYCYTDRTTAWLLTSVPRVSLATILDTIRERFPAHYTWDRPAYVRDQFRAVTGGFRCAWAMRKTPFRAIREGIATYIDAAPHRITPKQRMQFAALLVDAVRPKHAAGIYHNNITPHTVFFPDALSPKVLCNYGGTVPEVMAQYIPDEIRNRRRAATFGEQSMDTYALALIVHELITGERIEGPAFELDKHRPLVIPAALQRQFEGRFGWMNVVVAVVREMYTDVARLIDTCRLTFDESREVRFRRLTRASGSLVRSLPGIRRVADIWFPTETALMLRSILDRQYNEKLLGADSSLNRQAEVKRNANCAYIRAALPAQPLPRRCRIARVVQQVIEEAQDIPQYPDEDEVARRGFELRLEKPYLIRYAVTAIALLLLCVGSTRHDFTAPSAQARSVTADEQPTEVTRTRGCEAHLTTNRKIPGVYRVTDMRHRCRTADILVPQSDSIGTYPASLGETYTRLYVTKRGTLGTFSDIITVRQCPSESRGCEPGEFYRIVGLGGLGKRIELDEGDVVSFRREFLEAFVQTVEPLECPAGDSTASETAGAAAGEGKPAGGSASDVAE